MSNPCGEIINGDCLQELPRLATGMVDLVFADPPYNIGYNYNGEYQDQLSDEEYIHWCSQWMRELWRVLKPSGSFFLAIGDEYAAELKLAAEQIGFTLRNWIIWHYRFGQNTRNKFARAHTHIFYLVSDPKHFTFNADAVRVMSGRQKNYADKRAYKTLGKVPDDVWDEFPRVAGTFDERSKEFPCQMPEALLARIIRTTTQPDDLVLDPFSGSGTTLVVAQKLGRNFLGIERSSRFARQIQNRLKNLQRKHSGKLHTDWPVRHLDELVSLYLESGVALDRLMQHNYLAELFTRQFHLRIETTAAYTSEELFSQLRKLRKSNRLPRPFIQDDSRSYSLHIQESHGNLLYPE
ncbi:MAG: hypothetical protein HJJLKODD_02163 [Phycisphaerae bacterium]|nr:hypothetical protein [Phycisphaerae bacterium]